MGTVRKCLITGTHGCGKSTLSHRICSELKKRGYNAVVISETARESPFPINHGQTLNSTLYIALKQSVKELEAIAHGYTYLVLDRGVLDSFMYSEALRTDPIEEVEKNLIQAFISWTKAYDDIIFIKSEGNERLQSDGVRDTDMDYAKKVEGLFEEFLTKYFPEKLRTITHKDLLNCRVRIGNDGEVIFDYE